MRLVIYGVVFLVAVSVFGSAYVRLAPSDPKLWNTPITAPEDVDSVGGAIRVLQADLELFRRVRHEMGALPRTQVVMRARKIVGAQDERRITFVTRSLIWGFPDYTTVQFSDGVLKLYGRLRFGRSDLGVNGKRLQGVLGRAQGG
ncbi:DUF1499 domain-containing protein [Tateyamaria sp.]|uniref:DUF1499 domain-containing protein n=1 Tax=Tateyamaria sp. TaxID=1929288 RepID=UPI00329AA477